LKKLSPFLVSLTFFVLLFYFLPPEEIFNFLSLVSLQNLAIAFAFYGLSHLARTIRWKLLLKDLSFFQTFLVNSANVFLNNLLPARTGELSWFYYSKAMGVEFKRSLGVFLLGRLMDLLALFVLLSFFYALKEGRLNLYLVPFLLVFFSFLSYFPLAKLKSLQVGFFNFAISFFLSLCSSFLKFSSLVFLVSLEPSVMLFLSFLGGELSTILPIHSFGGFGTYELSFSIPQKLFGESLMGGIKLAFVFHVFLLLSSAIFGMFSLFVLYRKLQ